MIVVLSSVEIPLLVKIKFWLIKLGSVVNADFFGLDETSVEADEKEQSDLVINGLVPITDAVLFPLVKHFSLVIFSVNIDEFLLLFTLSSVSCNFFEDGAFIETGEWGRLRSYTGPFATDNFKVDDRSNGWNTIPLREAIESITSFKRRALRGRVNKIDGSCIRAIIGWAKVRKMYKKWKLGDDSHVVR